MRYGKIILRNEVSGLKKYGAGACTFGIFMNFALFAAKLYVALSANSLSVYCDSVNNLLDVISCVLGLVAFILCARLDDRQAQRLQSLCTFVIGLIITLTGVYFIYNGIQRTLYPAPITYSIIYVKMLTVTIPAKALMAYVYRRLNRGIDTSVLKALLLDSLLDCAITAFALIGLLLVPEVGFALDGAFAISLGGVITVTAVSSTLKEARHLIND